MHAIVKIAPREKSSAVPDLHLHFGLKSAARFPLAAGPEKTVEVLCEQ